MTSLENQSRVLYYNMLMKADNERFSVLIVSIKPVKIFARKTTCLEVAQ